MLKTQKRNENESINNRDPETQKRSRAKKEKTERIKQVMKRQRNETS